MLFWIYSIIVLCITVWVIILLYHDYHVPFQCHYEWPSQAELGWASITSGGGPYPNTWHSIASSHHRASILSKSERLPETSLGMPGCLEMPWDAHSRHSRHSRHSLSVCCFLFGRIFAEALLEPFGVHLGVIGLSTAKLKLLDGRNMLCQNT